MTADPQENFNVASLPEYEEVFEDNDDGDDDDDGVDEDDGDNSSRREDVLILMLGKFTRRRRRIFEKGLSTRDDDGHEFLK